MSSGQVVALGQGRFAIRGELGFASVPTVLRQSADMFAGQPQIDIDLDGVDRTDSAGLALLVEWLREARIRGQAIRFRNLPAALQGIAELSNVRRMLDAGYAPQGVDR